MPGEITCDREHLARQACAHLDTLRAAGIEWLPLGEPIAAPVTIPDPPPPPRPEVIPANRLLELPAEETRLRASTSAARSWWSWRNG